MALLIVLPLSVIPALAQQPSDPPPVLRFDVIRYEINGNTLLSPAELSRAVAPHTGKQKDFSDVQRALESLEVAYRQRGYGVVQVTLPEQNIASGVVRFEVGEPRLSRVEIDGAKLFDAANIRRSIPGLREGQTPNSMQIARNLLLANENPARHSTVLMRGGESDALVDATIKVVEEKPWKASLSLDNTGTTTTGDYRLSAGFQHANMFNRDHVMTLQYITSPDHISDVKIYGLGYRVPFYEWGSSLEVVAGYSNVNSGNIQGVFSGSGLSVSGSGTIGGMRYNQYLNKVGDYEQKLVYGMDYKAYKNQVLDAQGQNTVPDITVHPASVTYYGTWRKESLDAGFYLSVAQNIFPGGNDGANSDFQGPTAEFPFGSRAEAKAGFRVYRYGANFGYAFENEWQTRFQMTGQYSRDALVAGEQFGIGGAENLRGFAERETANDRGYRANAELYTPNLAPKLGWKGAQTRLLAFYDWGTVTRINPGAESPGQSLASIGAGLRVAASRIFSMRLDYAHVLDAGSNQDKGHTRVHGSISLVY